MIDGGSSWEKKDRQSAATISEGRRRTFQKSKAQKTHRRTQAREQNDAQLHVRGFVYM
jgi:hypothetical protein